MPFKDKLGISKPWRNRGAYVQTLKMYQTSRCLAVRALASMVFGISGISFLSVLASNYHLPIWSHLWAMFLPTSCFSSSPLLSFLLHLFPSSPFPHLPSFPYHHLCFPSHPSPLSSFSLLLPLSSPLPSSIYLLGSRGMCAVVGEVRSEDRLREWLPPSTMPGGVYFHLWGHLISPAQHCFLQLVSLSAKMSPMTGQNHSTKI